MMRWPIRRVICQRDVNFGVPCEDLSDLGEMDRLHRMMAMAVDTAYRNAQAVRGARRASPVDGRLELMEDRVYYGWRIEFKKWQWIGFRPSVHDGRW